MRRNKFIAGTRRSHVSANRSRFHRSFLSVIGACSSAMFIRTVAAQQWLPTGGGGYYWNNAANWNGGVPNSSTATVYLTPTSKLTANQTVFEEGQSLNRLIIGDPGATYSQSLSADGNAGSPDLNMGSAGGTAVIDVNGPVVSTYTDSFVAPTAVLATLNMHNSNLQMISNDVAQSTNPDFNSFSLGTGLINGANVEITHLYCLFGGFQNEILNYSGTTTLDGGYSTLTPDDIALPSTTVVNLSDSTDRLNLAGISQTIVGISGSGTVELDNVTLTTTGTTTFSGHLINYGNLDVSGGTLTLSGDNTVPSANGTAGFSGNFAVAGSASTLSIAANNALGIGTSAISLQGGALLATESFTLNRDVLLGTTGGTINTSSGVVLTANSAISGNTLSKAGAGTLVLTNSNDYFSALNLLAGTLQYSSDYAFGSDGNPITLLGGTLELLSNGYSYQGGTVTLVGNGNVTVDSGATLYLTGTINYAFTGTLVDSGSGTLFLSGTNTYTGGTVINGNVSILTDRNLGDSAGSITFGSHFVTSGHLGFNLGGTLSTTGSFSSTRNIAIGSYGATLIPSAGTTAALSGVISGGAGGGGLTINGPGTIQLSGTNNYSGGSYVTGGATLAVFNDTNLGNSSSGVELNNGTLSWQGAGSTSRTFTIDGNGGSVNVPLSQSLQVNGLVAGTGTLTKTGVGILSLLNNSNSFSGGTVISGGNLVVGPTVTASTTPIGSGPVTLNGGKIIFNGTTSYLSFEQSLAVSGFNQDVVVERTASNYSSAVTSAFDTPGSKTSGYAFYENGFNGNSAGLPQNHTFTSASNSAVTFALQPYNASNSLQLASSGTNMATLTLNQPGKFTSISFLAAASGTASDEVILQFSDGTSAASNVTIPDWFSNNNPALVVGSRISLVDGSVQYVSGYPRLFEFDIAVPAADANEVVTGITFDNRFTSGSPTVNVMAVSGNGQLLDPGQTYNNSVSVTAPSTIVSTSLGTTLGALSIASNTLTVQGPNSGTLTFLSANLTGGNLFDVANGYTLNLGAITGGGGISLTDAGTLTLLANGNTLSYLNGLSGKLVFQGDRSHLIVGSLYLGSNPANPSGLLDLRDNDLIIQNGNLSNITAEIRKAFNSGTWNGSAGITSSLAAANPLLSLGTYLDSSNLFNAGHRFDGYTPATTDVLIKYTYFGDANLDGKVDGSDYSLIDSGYVTNSTGWQNGDFNYDGIINGSDYTLIDNAFNRQGAQFAAVFAPTSQIAVVPEPSSIALSGLAASILLSRRRFLIV